MLPWKVADGPPVTKRLIFTGPRGGHVWRTSLNEEVWKRAHAGAGVIPVPERRHQGPRRVPGPLGPWPIEATWRLRASHRQDLWITDQNQLIVSFRRRANFAGIVAFARQVFSV